MNAVKNAPTSQTTDVDSAIQNATPKTDAYGGERLPDDLHYLSNKRPHEYELMMRQFKAWADFARTLERERSLAVSALKASAYALNSPDAHRRKVVAELVIACLTQMGETIGEIP